MSNREQGHGQTRAAPRRWRYWALMTGLGVLGNALAVTAPGAVPFLLGNTATMALALRLSPLWAMSSALLVGAATWDPGWCLFTLVHIALACLLRHFRLTRPWRFNLLMLALLAPLALWLAADRGLGWLAYWMSAGGLLIGALVAYAGAVQINLVAQSTRQRAAQSSAEQLASSMSVAWAAPLCLLLAASWQWLWWDGLDQQLVRLELVSRRVAEQVSQQVDGYRRVIELAAGETQLPDRLPRLDRVQQAFPDFLTLLISDAQGEIVHFHAPGAGAVSGNVTDRSYFQVPSRSGQSHVSDVFRGRGFGNDVLVAIGAPHLDAEGRFAGVVQGALALERLQQRLHGLSAPDSIEFVLIDGSERVVASSHAALSSLDSATSPVLQSAASKRSLPIDRSGRYLMQETALNALGWRLVCLRSLAPLRDRQSQGSALLALLSLLLIAALARQSRRFAAPFVRPLRDMLEHVREVDLTLKGAPTPLRLRGGNREVAELVEDFNSMLLRIDQLNKELRVSLTRGESLNRELEQRVEERTRELLDALKRAEQLAQAKSTFLANMSHELRTPLSAILGFAARALSEGEARSSWRNTLQTIDRHGRHLLAVVNDILDASRIDSGQMTVESLPVSPLQVVEDVVSMLNEPARLREPQLRVDLHWPLPASIDADPLRLRQVLINLIGNALKFTERGEVTVVLSCSTEHELHIEVRDTGVGMSETQLERLFRAFEQADISTTRRFGGSGLGLFISDELVRAMGGRIEVTSRLGEGSCFRVILPLPSPTEWLQKQPIAIQDADPVPAVPALRGRVLVVDDVPDLRQLIEHLVVLSGADVTCAENGAEAVEQALAAPFDLILMDIHMPVMDGRSATRALRARGYQGAIVALTADVLQEDVQSFLAAGCNDVLSKPVDASTLYSHLSLYLSEDTQPRKSILAPAIVSATENSQVAQLLSDIRQRFAEHFEEEIEELQRASKESDPSTLADRLHRLRGSAGTFGFGRISELAAAAERSLSDSPAARQDAVAALLKALSEAKPP